MIRNILILIFLISIKTSAIAQLMGGLIIPSQSAGEISSLDCNEATTTGTLVANTAAINVSSSVPYTGGNGGTHSGQAVNSTGVEGLTATLVTGTFASGAGNLTYTITGTPSAAGTASFALNIGEQNCSLSLLVAPMQFFLSGGIETTLGAETLLTFNNSGTLTVVGTGQARILIVGGGGGGRSSKSNSGNNGGGGGRVIEQYLTLNPGSYTVTIGIGGSSGGGNGGSSSISGVTLTANGGLGNGVSGAGFNPGSSGISSYICATTSFTSGGGAGASGNGSSPPYAIGGPGIDNNITGGTVQYGYGGMGGAYDGSLPYTCAIGTGGGYISGNNGGTPTAVNAATVIQNRGDGGNGGGNTSTRTALSSAGSRGVIIIRYTKVL